jgi:3-dehydroquinate synthase
MHFKKPQIVFSDKLPDLKLFKGGKGGSAALLIHDRILLNRVPNFGDWAKKFPASYAVEAGEELKDLASYSKHLEKILTLANQFSPRELSIVVAGGGSVGDFGGFTASILKRGVNLIQIPTTWLAAIDSAHGGKTALNVAGVKNQIGTYYPASQVFLVRAALFAQTSAQAQDAAGELAKIALIEGGSKWLKLATASEQEGRLLWRFLPDAIAAKYRIVQKDPFEKKNIRQFLNLGHTLGHILEAYHGFSHGSAVAQGLLFSVEWSRKKKLLKASSHIKILNLLNQTFQFTPLTEIKGFSKIPKKDFMELLLSDKKRHSTSEISFVFLKDYGKPLLKNTPALEILAEARAQGWVET